MVPVIRVLRTEENRRFGTFGVLLVQAEVLCFTLEPPDLLNAEGVSSIPAQQYHCKRIVSPSHGETFKIMDVPGRTNVLFHSGNLVVDTKGCVVLGKTLGMLQGERGLLNSRAAFKEFMERLIDFNEAHLTVREVY